MQVPGDLSFVLVVCELIIRKKALKTFLVLHLNVKLLMKYLAILGAFKQKVFCVPRESSETASGKCL